MLSVDIKLDKWRGVALDKGGGRLVQRPANELRTKQALPDDLLLVTWT